MLHTDKLIICGNETEGFGYLYHKIIGDGHCFINCYLDTCCPSYQKEKSGYKKAFIARKARLDFANYLMSESTKDPRDICVRLNIFNPSVMGTFFKNRGNDESTYPLFLEIENSFRTIRGIEFEQIYGMILSLDLLVNENLLWEFIMGSLSFVWGYYFFKNRVIFFIFFP